MPDDLGFSNVHATPYCSHALKILNAQRAVIMPDGRRRALFFSSGATEKAAQGGARWQSHTSPDRIQPSTTRITPGLLKSNHSPSKSSIGGPTCKPASWSAPESRAHPAKISKKTRGRCVCRALERGGEDGLAAADSSPLGVAALCLRC